MNALMQPEVLIYSKHNVHGLIHDWVTFLLCEIELRPII